MDFNEKLQKLRNNCGLTQEQLAEKLYVSRTAVSKWESGRGYPSIDSLKMISKYYSVPVDELLSGDELVTLAEDDKKNSAAKTGSIVFGIFDIMALLFIFLPFYSQEYNGYFYSISLISCSDMPPFIKGCYFVFLIGICLCGIVELILVYIDKESWMPKALIMSLVIHVVGVMIFIMTQQPYAATFWFCILIVKASLLLNQRRKSAQQKL